MPNPGIPAHPLNVSEATAPAANITQASLLAPLRNRRAANCCSVFFCRVVRIWR
jgi:hypothetical protein